MANHPLNLAFRFLLELIGLGSMAWSSYHYFQSPYKLIFAIIFPLLFAFLWAGFRFRPDHGKGLIYISGIARLLLEFLLFAIAVKFLLIVGEKDFAWVFLSCLIVHYLLSYDRIWLMIKAKP